MSNNKPNRKHLLKAIDLLGDQTTLAQELELTQGQVSSWVVGRRPIPAKHCRTIETLTKGAVTRFDLRPDIFGAPADVAA